MKIGFIFQLIARFNYLHKMIKMTVGQEMAIYKWAQLLTKRARTGKRITPTDQNCSKSVVIIVFGFPAVMSETKVRNKNIINLHNIYIV